ncbi:MAG: class I SAM-dependent methyltransferase [Sphingobacteriaceae bacterium]|nr:class I SAM-dependent methyltransferase [Cytophagaceae bacterium]
MLLLSPTLWQTYELLDSGNFEKLERFGDYVLSRPEPQALWDRSLPDAEWNQGANAIFKKEKGSSERGEWVRNAGMPERWTSRYQHGRLDLTFKLALSSFKHVGLFPEQAANWDYLAEHLPRFSSPPKVLNLFAYTGLASLAARACGAEVTHVDAVKQVITWSRENMELSGLTDIRWVVEDALKFVKREVRRGNRYQCLILDPPAYGRGPDGEKWLLEENLGELLKACRELLDPERQVFILNLYSLGFSALIVENLIRSVFGSVPGPEFGELYLEDAFGKKLPLGVFFRFATR